MFGGELYNRCGLWEFCGTSGRQSIHKRLHWVWGTPRIPAGVHTGISGGGSMWYIRLLILLVINLAVILFALANVETRVTLRWWNPAAAGFEVNLTLALIVAYLLGCLTLLVVSAVREIQLRRRARDLRRQLESAREELNRLRTAPLDDPANASLGPSAVGSATGAGTEEA